MLLFKSLNKWEASKVDLTDQVPDHISWTGLEKLGLGSTMIQNLRQSKI